MRIPQWPRLVCGALLVAVIGRTAFADDSPNGYIDSDAVVSAEYDSGELFEEAAYEGAGGYGAAYQPVQYLQDPAAMPGYGTGDPYGPVYPPNTWPEISPYAHRFESFQNDGGLWAYNVNDEDPRGILGVDFLVVWGQSPGNQLIGSQVTEFAPGSPSIFPAQRTTNIGSLVHYGVRARYGWENPDESAVILSGFYVGEHSFTSGPNTPYANPIYGQPNPPLGIQPLASITFQDPTLGPIQSLYDTFFQKVYDQQFWGADLDLYAAPFFRRPSFKMQMTWGVKYVRIFESMSVRAIDSNLAYVVDTSTGEFSDITNLGFPPLQTEINSQVTSNIVGPHIGVRYDLGGNKFKIWGQSKFAVGVNMDRSRVYGNNAITNLDLAFLGPSSFSNGVSHTHISPIFEQSIYGEFPIFSAIPIVNRIALLNQAIFKVGFNYLLIGEMARPAKSITYTYGSPTPNADRSTFSLKTLSFGLDWHW